MRLLFLNHNVIGTGTFHRAWHLARQIVAAGHDVTVVTTSRTARWQPREHHADGVHVIEAPDLLNGAARTGWDAWNTAWRVRRLVPERYDLIHAFDCRPAVIGPALAHRSRTGQPLFLDWADWWGRGGTIEERSGWVVRTFFGPVETWFEEAFRAGATGNTTISEPLRERCIGLGADPGRVLLLPNGCAEPVGESDRAAARAVLGMPADVPLLLHLGVMQRRDAAFLFAALRLALARRPQVRLVLVGRHGAAIPQDLADRVVATGFVAPEHMRTWLAAADAAVVPLRDTIASRGRWPSKVNEYLSAGLPTVMPAVGGAAEVLRDGGAGVLCEPTEAAFADALLHLLADAAERTRLSANARLLAAGSLAWSPIAARLLAFYGACTDSGAAAYPPAGAVAGREVAR